MEVIKDYNNKKPIKIGIISVLFVALLIAAILIAFLYIINNENKNEKNISEIQTKTEGESLTKQIISTTLTSCINNMMNDPLLDLAQKYTEENSYMEDNMISAELTTQEVQAFNSTWLEYEGEQNGEQIKSLINQMIAFANTYRDEPEKIIKVKYIDEQNMEKTIEYLDELTTYISELNDLYTQIRVKLKYKVEVEFGNSGLINQIVITYINQIESLEGNLNRIEKLYWSMSTLPRKKVNIIIYLQGQTTMSARKGEKMKENKAEEKIQEIDNKKKIKKVILTIVIAIIVVFSGRVIIKILDNYKNTKINLNSNNNEMLDECEKDNNNLNTVINEADEFLNNGSNVNLNVDIKKPIIYLYPEQETEVTVKLGKEENLTCTYPKYESGGWKVLAKPNGDLVDLKTGRNLYSLYWEGINTKEYNSKLEEGFVVKGEDTIKFLEEKLEILGLSQTEAQEFIVYWLPQMENNKYNYIRFQTKEEIEENMPLEITPKPDTIIRVMMEWKELDEYVEVKEQKLMSTERKGFVAVEWGGTKIKNMSGEFYPYLLSHNDV